MLPCVQNEEPVVRNMAFYCLGSASLLDVNQAQKYFHLLLQASDKYVCACAQYNVITCRFTMVAHNVYVVTTGQSDRSRDDTGHSTEDGI